LNNLNKGLLSSEDLHADSADQKSSLRMQIKIKMNKSDENASSGARFDGCPVVVVKL
jgi:hypothetical protein